LKELHKIEPKYSKVELTEFKNENQFMDAYVELLKQTITLLYFIVGDRYCEGKEGIPSKINRNEAIIGGNLTRLIKLNTSFLENICNEKLEICCILNRCIAETAINTQFMIVEGEDNVLKNYIKYSLITEKQLWNTIKENVEDKNNEKSHIEERMQKSIERSFNSSDFDLESVNRSSKWKKISERAQYVAGDQFYKIFYGISSHSVHGNWQDILSNNLTRENDGFKVNLEWNRPRPQIMDGAIGMNLLLTKSFVEKEKLKDLESYLEKTELLMNYQSDLLNQHEKYLKK
jgi:hypothetical protein|tara:strand:- start:193 stop:1059 length:867 start_codon:yes stop_codon:yes gene_type:complete